MPLDPDRRRLIVGAGAAIAAGALGLGAAATQWLRSDADDAIDTAASSSTSATATSTTTSTSTSTTVASSTSSSAGTTTTADDPVTTEAAPPTGGHPVGDERLEVLCRASWGAAAPTGALPHHTIDELTVHHTAAVLSDNRKAPSRVRSFQKGHQDDGFVDLAYHYVIDAHGNVYEGRSTTIPGETYTSYDPTGHFLAVCDGNFEEQAVPAAQLDALALLLAWASAHFGVAPSRLTGHRDEAATACPGEHLYATLRDGTLRAKIDAHLAHGAPQLTMLCGADGAARVAAIKAGSD